MCSFDKQNDIRQFLNTIFTLEVEKKEYNVAMGLIIANLKCVLVSDKQFIIFPSNYLVYKQEKMLHVGCLTFNPFQENTYVVYDESKDCIIFDPGCYSQMEREQLKNYINEHNLHPVKLINTHCHIDHVFGNQFIANEYSLKLEIHRGELTVLKTVPQIGQLYGIPLPDTQPEPGHFIEEGDVITIGDSSLVAILTPGHSPASLSFYCDTDKVLIAGDVLFDGSIGRTDLPGGDYNTLIRSIKEKLLPLGDDVTVYPGHGGSTTIGKERVSNPFLT